MKHFLPLALLAVFPLLLQAQSVNPTTACPGVPGACGYTSGNQSVQRGPQNPAPQDGNGTLGVIYDQQLCGLDYTAASQRIGQRFTPQGVPQPAPFVISGIPACAVIERAYLWAEGSGNGAAQTATIAGPSGTQNFPMAVCGQGPDKCWGYSGSYTYRADVTSVISGNGTYNISGLLTNPPTTGNDMDGATLLVVWSDPSQSWAGRIVIADGAIVINGGTTTYNMPISPVVCGATTNARAFMGVGDIQFAPGPCTANTTPVPIAWNWWNFEQVNTTVAVGSGNAPFTMVANSDCYNLCIAGLYFRTTTCTSCPTSTAMTASISSTPATCSQCNGTATVSNVTGATGPFTYSWSPSGGNAATATGLCAGNYTVTITSANGCQVLTQTVNVASAGGAVSLTSSGVTNASCFAGADGSATVVASGGSSPYTFSWSPVVPSTSTFTQSTATGMSAGTYIVTTTDINGCTGQQTVTITAPTAVNGVLTSTAVACPNDSSGSVSVTASGGTGPYTYLWSPSGATTPTVNGLPGGSYSVTVTDNNGCTFTQTVAITSPPAMVTAMTATNVLCFGGNTGSAAVSISGGSPGFTYQWSPAGGTNDTATGLSAGVYTVVTTDANGCTSTSSVSVTEPPQLTVSTTSTPVNCFGQGTATATPSGGNGGYTYVWTSGGTAATETNLAPGSYSVTVTDNNGCTATQSVSVTQVSPLSVSSSATDPTCFGGNNGSAGVTVTGGSTPYTYVWSPSGGTNATATGLSAGTYTVLITDANGCTFSQSVTLTQPTQITGSTSGTGPNCNGSTNGTALVTASGGTGALTYNWLPSGGTAATATNLGAGTYTVIVTDANGCTFTGSVVLTQPPAITATGTGNQVCPGSTATLLVTASGGASPYTYAWSNGPTTATQTLPATNANVGTYTVTVTDANGCTQTATAALALLPAPTAAYTTDATNGVVVLNNGTGQICFTDASTGGASTWAWNFNGQGTSSAQSPCFPVTIANSGQFCTELIVQNSNGCFDTTSACVEIGQSSYSIPNVFTPNADGNNDQWIITNDGMTRLHCTIYDRWGALIYEWDGTTGNWDGRTSSGKEAVDGVYYFTAELTDFQGKNYAEHGFFQLIR